MEGIAEYLLWHFSRANKDLWSQGDAPAKCLNCWNCAMLNDSTVSDWSLISSPWHPCWRGGFPNTPVRKHRVYGALQTAGSHSTGPGAVFATAAFHPAAYTLKPPTHCRTPGRHLNISWPRCADIDWGWGYLPRAPLHYSLPSLVAGLICVDKGLHRSMWFGLRRSDSTIFIPTVELQWQDSSISMLNHLYGTGPEVDLKSVPCTYQLLINCSCLLALDQIWKEIWAQDWIFFSPRRLSAVFTPQVSLAGWSYCEKQLFGVSLGCCHQAWFKCQKQSEQQFTTDCSLAGKILLNTAVYRAFPWAWAL